MPDGALLIRPTGCLLFVDRIRRLRRIRQMQHAKKKPVLAYELFLKYGGEAGVNAAQPTITDLPDGASLIRPTGCSSFVGRIRCLHRIRQMQYAKKKPVLAYELFFKYGGEAGIRTPDTLPYTHFPGVLLQPLGHLTILFCCLTAWGATGRYYRELR